MKGISRAYIFELAEQLSLQSIEKNTGPYDGYTADEAFVTSIPFYILPVTSVNSIPIGEGKMGEISKMFLDRWSENVGVDIVAQIKAFNQDFVF